MWQISRPVSELLVTAFFLKFIFINPPPPINIYEFQDLGSV